MIPAPLPDDEQERLDALYAFDVLDTLPEEDLDDITRLASVICETPIALVSLIDKDRQWFKSRVGLDVPETHRDLAFCAYTILNPNEVMVVPDTLHDERFHDSPLVTGYPHIRFYAGAPLITSAGDALGSLCVIDDAPRELSQKQLDALNILSRSVVAKLELMRSNKQLQHKQEKMEQLVQELYEKNNELDYFASIAAHDISEPIATISSLADAVSEKYAATLPAEVTDFINHTRFSTAQLSHLTTDLLDSARAGHDTLPRIVVDGNILTSHIRHNLDALIHKSGADLNMGEFPRLHCNPGQIMRGLQNLISNALQYQPDGQAPKVDVQCQDIGTHWQITVRDNGLGIEDKYLQQIFKPFFRLHRFNDVNGTGIGLDITRKIAIAHGGDVRVESVVGQGSTFYFTLAKPAA